MSSGPTTAAAAAREGEGEVGGLFLLLFSQFLVFFSIVFLLSVSEVEKEEKKKDDFAVFKRAGLQRLPFQATVQFAPQNTNKSSS